MFPLVYPWFLISELARIEARIAAREIREKANKNDTRPPSGYRCVGGRSAEPSLQDRWRAMAADLESRGAFSREQKAYADGKASALLWCAMLLDKEQASR